MNDGNFLIFLSNNAVVSKWKKIPFKKKNSIQCIVSIPASLLDFHESILNLICKKWFSFNHEA